MSVEVIDAAQFKEKVLNNESAETIIIDFFAEWCAPCRMIAPLLEEIAAENDDVRIYKINVDQHPELAGQYDIKSIPNMVSFRKGALYKRVIGAQPKDRILELIR